MENENNISDLKEKFKLECEVVNLSYEYPGYDGKEKFGIITSLNDRELNEKYAKLIKQFSPYIILPQEMKMVRRIYGRNDEKFEKRYQRNLSKFGIDDKTEKIHIEVSLPSAEDILMAKEEKSEIHRNLNKAISRLPEIQKRRIIKYYINNMTFEEIGKSEKCSAAAVCQSVEVAIKNMKKYFMT